MKGSHGIKKLYGGAGRRYGGGGRISPYLNQSISPWPNPFSPLTFSF